MNSITFSLSHVIAAAITLVIAAAVIKIVFHVKKRWKEMDEGIHDAHARIDAIATELKKYISGANLEFNPASTQNIDKRSVREKLSKKKTWIIIIGFACVGLVAAQFLTGSDTGGSKDHARPGKHAKVVQASDSDKDEAPAAVASKSDACGSCKVEKVPDDQLETRKTENGWLFLGHKCVGSDCDACEVDNCTGPSNESSPTGPCNHCSRKAKQ